MYQISYLLMLTLRQSDVYLLQGLSLLLLSASLGLILTAYDVSATVWIGTELILLYLVWAGVEAIALSLVWVVGLVWAGVFCKSWLNDIPWISVTVWTGALGLSWAIGLLLMLSIAFLHRSLEQQNVSKGQIVVSLGLIVLLGLRIGQVGYGAIGSL